MKYTYEGNSHKFSQNRIPMNPWDLYNTWRRHQMETCSAFLALWAGNSPVPGEFPSQRPVTRSFDVFFHLCLNERLSKQSWGSWFETPSRSLWRHCNDIEILFHAKYMYMYADDMIFRRIFDLSCSVIHEFILYIIRILFTTLLTESCTLITSFIAIEFVNTTVYCEALCCHRINTRALY